MMRHSSILLGLCLLTLVQKIRSQDIHFSQYEQTPQLLNPGATGNYDGKGRAIVNYKNQWGIVGNAYNTFAASFDIPVLKKKGNGYLGLGGNIYKDVAGDSKFGNSIGSISLAGLLPVSEAGTISMGIQTGIGQYFVDLSNVTWGNQFTGKDFNSSINSNENLSVPSSNYLDIGAGMYYHLNNTTSGFNTKNISEIEFGVAAFHVNRPKRSFLDLTRDKLPIKYVVQGSLEESFNHGRLSVIPSFFYARQGAHTETNVGALLKMQFGNETKYTGFYKQSAVYFGANYRWKDAVIAKLFLEYHDYMIGFSYDVNVSSFSEASRSVGGFEISIKYTNKTKPIMSDHSK